MEFSKKVKVINKLGFHLRAVAIFVIEADRFKSDIKVVNGHIEADAKSTLGLLTLEAGVGKTITIKADGPDAREAVDKLVSIVENKFGEPE